MRAQIGCPVIDVAAFDQDRRGGNMKAHSMLMTAGLVLTAHSAMAGKPAPTPTCGTDVYVTTTVTAGLAIAGEGTGVYVTGGTRTNKVESRFQIGNCSHDYTLGTGARPLTVQLSNGLTLPGVFWNIDRVASVPVTSGNDTALDTWCAAGLQRDANGFVRRDPVSGYMLDNYGGCGVDANGRYVRRAAVFVIDDGSNSVQARLDYQASPQDMNAPACGGIPDICTGAYVKVYHPSANRWVIRFDGQGAADGPGGVYRGSGLRTEEWTPFEITATNP
jgi:hypothetical protein